MRDIFFSAGYFSPCISLQDIFSLEINLQDIFSLEINLQKYFFLKSPITPQKSNGRPLITSCRGAGNVILEC